MEIIVPIILSLIAGGITFFSIKRKGVKNWLLLAVEEAEKTLVGEKKGQERFAQVYNKFIEDFPIFSKFISSKDFSKLLEKALETMKSKLNQKES